MQALRPNPQHQSSKNYPGYLRRRRRSNRKISLFAGVLLLLVFLVFGSADDLFHHVEEYDTLYSLGRQYGVSVRQLRLANKLADDDGIRIGQKLLIPVSVYFVEEGESLSAVAQKLDIDEKKLIQLNHLNNGAIYAGQSLITVQKPVAGQTYVVQKGDILSYISMRFDVSQTDLVRFNDLESPALVPGQVLQLTSNRPQNYTVRENDTLYSLARKYNVTVDQLMQYNALNSSDIRPGQELVMYSPTYSDFDDTASPVEKQAVKLEQETKIASVAPAPQKPQQPAQSRPQEKPSVNKEHDSQPSLTYQRYEDERHTEANYKKAKALIAALDEELVAMGSLGQELKGYHVVLDSGHGGNDPGAVVSQKINGKTMYFIEDEYNYDVTMRLYVLLKRHGAEVSLTNLSPDHTIRDNNISKSFVNVKNEVANDENQKTRLKGGGEALVLRRKLVNKLFGTTKEDKRIFVSVHMDSSEHTVLGMVAVTSNPTPASLALGESIVKANGRGQVVKTPYIMVTNNAAPAAVLVEVRNLQQESALLYNSYSQRQKDAEKIAAGIVSYAAGR